jgi:hypothetical protein
VSFHPAQFRDHVVRPTLRDMGMWSTVAERLVLGTVAVESDFGRYLAQQNNGPAVGVAQMEPATAGDILFRYLNGRGETDRRFQRAFQVINDGRISWKDVPLSLVAEKLKTDLRFAVGLCRLRYWMVPDALPLADDLPALAAYWKAHYNTSLGRGSVADFIKKYTVFDLHALPY